MIKPIEHDLLSFEWKMDDLPDADELIVIIAKRLNRLISEHNDLLRVTDKLLHPPEKDRRPLAEAHEIMDRLLREGDE